MPLNLTAERALLFRITHVRNLPWILANGVHCANGTALDPSFVPIGNHDLIRSRATRAVPLPPRGTLSDYVPFYFTPKSIMLLNIKTGYNGVTKRSNDEIVILVSSCEAMRRARVNMLYTDRHAYTETAAWTANHLDLAQMLDWDILCRHDFARSDSYPDKKERYQAEALAYGHVPPRAILGIACASEAVRPTVESQVSAAVMTTQVLVRPTWYF